MANTRLFATSDVVKTLLCFAVLLAACSTAWAQGPATTPTTSRAAPAAEENPDIITFEPANPIDMEVLVEYVGRLLQLKFIYDNQDLTQAGQISISPHQKIHVDELYHVLQQALLTKGLAMIRAGDWVRILPADRVPMFGDIVQPGQLGPVQVGETAVSEMVSLKFADPRDVQDTLTPFLSENGTAMPMPDQKVIVVSEYRSRMEMLRQLIKLVDVPPKRIVTRILSLEQTRAPDIATKLANYLQVLNQAQEKIIPVRTVTPAGVRMTYTAKKTTPDIQAFIEVDERTNRLFLYGPSENLDELQSLVLEFDVERVDFQEVVAYPLTYLAAESAVTSLTELNYIESGTTTTRTRTATTRTTTTGGRTATAAATTGDIGGSGAAARATILEETNTLIIRATHDEQERIRLFLKEADIDRPDQDRIQVYPLDRRLAEDVAEYLKSVFQSDTVDTRTRTPIPGVEGAPVIVAVVDTNSIVANATPAQHKQIKNLLDTLDATQPQVLLQCILVEVTSSDDLDVGLELETSNGLGPGQSIFGSTSFEMSSRDTTTGLRAVAAADPGATIAFVNDGVVNVLLHAMKEDSKGRVLSKPRIVVESNKEGTIEANDQAPTVTVETVDNVTTEKFAGYEDAGTTLKITPRISENDFLALHIEAEMSTFTGTSSSSGVPPPKANRTINTDIVVPDQRTVIIGGLNGRRRLETVTKIPIIGDIPLVGELFRHTVTEDTDTTIYLFVKASILRETTFRDLHDETDQARRSIPTDLRELDEELSDEAMLQQIARLKELQDRRAAEKALLKAKQVIEGEGDSEEGAGSRIRVIPQKATEMESEPKVDTVPEVVPTPSSEAPAVDVAPTPAVVPVQPAPPATEEKPKDPLSSQPIIVPPSK